MAIGLGLIFVVLRNVNRRKCNSSLNKPASMRWTFCHCLGLHLNLKLSNALRASPKFFFLSYLFMDTNMNSVSDLTRGAIMSPTLSISLKVAKLSVGYSTIGFTFFSLRKVSWKVFAVNLLLTRIKLAIPVMKICYFVSNK